MSGGLCRRGGRGMGTLGIDWHILITTNYCQSGILVKCVFLAKNNCYSTILIGWKQLFLKMGRTADPWHTFTTINDLPQAGFIGRPQPKCPLFYISGRHGGLMVSVLDSGSGGPSGFESWLGHCLCSWAKYITLTVRLFTQVYKWVQLNLDYPDLDYPDFSILRTSIAGHIHYS